MLTRVSIDDIRAYMQPYNHFFGRPEVRELAARYILGLIMEGERKSAQPISMRVHVSERGLQRLLSRAGWDHAGLAAEYRRRLHSISNGNCNVLCVNDVWFLKKGKHSVCVARQYIPDLNRKVGAQLGVGLSIAGKGICRPYMLDLYVPKFWDSKTSKTFHARRVKTGMPEEARHRQTWQIALEQIRPALTEGIGGPLITGGREYGNVLEFRTQLDRLKLHYVFRVDPVLEVFSVEPVFREAGKRKYGRGRPARHGRNPEPEIPPVKIASLSGRLMNGVEGINSNRYAELRVWPAQGYREGIRNDSVRLIAESTTDAGDGHFDRFYFSNMPEAASREEILELCHRRDQAKELYAFMKKRLGLDHFEGRSWTGWHRHVLLVFLAYAYLVCKEREASTSQIDLRA